MSPCNLNALSPLFRIYKHFPCFACKDKKYLGRGIYLHVSCVRRKVWVPRCGFPGQYGIYVSGPITYHRLVCFLTKPCCHKSSDTPHRFVASPPRGNPCSFSFVRLAHSQASAWKADCVLTLAKQKFNFPKPPSGVTEKIA